MTTVDDPIAEALRDISRADDWKHQSLDVLALAVLRERDLGVTVRELAGRYGVAPSAIQTWTQHGRELREKGARPHAAVPRDGAPSVVLPAWAQWLLVALIVCSALLTIFDMLGHLFWF